MKIDFLKEAKILLAKEETKITKGELLFVLRGLILINLKEKPNE
jgi:hypothetical protein